MFSEVYITFIDVFYFAGALLSIHIVTVVSLGINISLTCIIRILCLGNLNFMEDSVGEKLTRRAVLLLSGLAGILACSALLEPML
jgi:hypothetical protein